MKICGKVLAVLLPVLIVAAARAQAGDQSTGQSAIADQIRQLRSEIDAQRAQLDKLQRQLAAQKSEPIRTQQAQVPIPAAEPDAIHYKGITLSPQGSFIEAATVYRSAATGGGI